MKKHGRSWLFAVILLSVLFVSLSALADFGPKRSVLVQFDHVPEGNVFAALMPKEGISTPAVTKGRFPETEKKILAGLKAADPGGYYYAGELREISGTGRYDWSYIAPREFKVLVYIENEDRILLSGPCSQYAFRSVFRADLSQAELKVERSYTWVHQLLAFLGRLAVTVLTEVLLGFVFGFRSRARIRFIILVNCVTQLALNIGMLFFFTNILLFYFMTFGVAELIVFIAEGALYQSKWRADGDVAAARIWIYAFTANLASMLLGFYLTESLPTLLQL